jgi:hypothetical protein
MFSVLFKQTAEKFSKCIMSCVAPFLTSLGTFQYFTAFNVSRSTGMHKVIIYLLSQLILKRLTCWSRVHLEELIDSQLTKKFIHKNAFTIFLNLEQIFVYTHCKNCLVTASEK